MAGGIGLQSADVCSGDQRNVGILERRIDADDLGVRLGAEEAGMPVARRTTNARALPGRLFVDSDAERDVKRPQPLALQIVMELLDARLMAHRWKQVGGAGVGLGWIYPASAVNLIEVLGLGVVGLQLVVSDRPSRRNPAMMAQFTEILAPQPE